MVVYLIYIWSILHPFGRCGHLVFLLPFGVVYPVLVYFIYCTKKNLATLAAAAACASQATKKEECFFSRKKAD
jgi:hypothetical protein